MQEVVDSLTEQKLALTIRINDLDKANSTLLVDLSKLRDEHKVADSIKSELERLSLENTDLIVTNKKLEVALKKADDKLEKAMEFAEVESNYVELKDKFDKLIKDQLNLENINIDLTSKNDMLNTNERKLTKSLDDQNQLLNKCKNQEYKLRLYKTKLIDFSAQLKQLKSCKEVLLITVKEYSVAVSKWQSEILIVSNEFFEKNRLLRKENKVLKDQKCGATAELNARDIELEQYKEKYTQLLNEFDLLQQEKEKISSLIENMRSENQVALDDNQDAEIKALKVLLNQTEQHCVRYKADLEHQTVLNKQNEALRLEENSTLTKDMEIAMSKYNDTSELVKDLRNELKNLKVEIELQKSSANDSIAQANQLYIEMDRNLNIQITDLQKQLAISEAESRSALSKTTDLETISSELECQTRTLNKLNQELTNKDKILHDTIQTKDKLVQSKIDELADLLSEMRELNEALKTRGDVISQQEQSIVSLESNRTKLQNRITELEVLIEAKSIETVHLTERINELERIVHSNDANNEQLSTSTVSRVEEMARMRDIDDSFEEKYNRLRAVAIKLKKKVAEQTKLLADLESKNNVICDEEIQISSKLGNIEVQVRNLQSLQSENDRLQDKLEVIELERKELNVTVAKLSAELANVKSSTADTESDVMESNKQKNALEQACKEYVKQIQALKEDINAGKVIHKALNDELNKLKGNIHLFILVLVSIF